MTWLTYYNSRFQSHYYLDESKNITLCNRELNTRFPNSQKITTSEDSKKCKTCLRVLSTYKDIRNFVPGRRVN